MMNRKATTRRFAGTHLDPDVYESLKRIAAVEHRSMSAMIAFFVRGGVSTHATIPSGGKSGNAA